MKKLSKDLIKARQYVERRKEKRKMKKLHAFEAWFAEATEGFAGTETTYTALKRLPNTLKRILMG